MSANAINAQQFLLDLNKPRGDALKVGLTSALHDAQIRMISPLYKDGVQLVMVPSSRKVGKALDLNTVVFTPDKGYVRWSDINVGSLLFGSDGKPTRVTHRYDHKNVESYKVTFKNGQSIIACADHEWFTWTKKDRVAFRESSYGVPRPSTKTTKQIFESQIASGEHNHSIPYAKAVELPEADLLIDPYILGVWLGDGHRNTPSITSIDQEIIDAWTAYATQLGLMVKKYKMSYRATTGNTGQKVPNKFLNMLRELDLTYNKHVPDQYLSGSIEQRLSLLQGLMDTDGTICKRGNVCTFDNTNLNLAEAVFHLVASLGMKPTMKTKVGKLNGVSHKLCYRINFHPMGNKIFRLSRKQEKVLPFRKKFAHHTIVEVEKVENRDMMCVTVDAKDHLFLASESFVPTHNSHAASYVAWRQCCLNPHTVTYLIGPEKTHIADIYWDNQRIQRFLGDDSEKYILKIKDRERMIMFKNGSILKLMGSENWKAAQGLTPDLLIYDEYKHFHPKFHPEMAPNVAAKGAKLFIVGTPPQAGDRNKAEYEGMLTYAKENPQSCHYEEFCVWDNPIMHLPANKAAIDADIARLRAMGDEASVQREYFAKIVPGGSRSIFPMFSRDRHVKRHDFIMDHIKGCERQFDWYCVIDPAGSSTYAASFIATHTKTKQTFVLDELYIKDRMQTSTKHVIPMIKEKMQQLNPDLKPRDWIKVCDEQAAHHIIEIITNYPDMAFIPSQKIKNNKDDMHMTLKDMFTYDKLILSDRCKNAAKEVEEYATSQDGVVVKNRHSNDHCFVEDTLVLTNTGDKKIKDIKVGDLVKTREGYKPVLKVWDNGLKETIKLNFSNNVILECTPEHKIYTKESSFIEARSLTRSNTYNTYSVWKRKKQIQSLLYIKELILEGIQTALDATTECIINVIQDSLKRVSDTSIGTYMSKRLALYQKATSFITKMVTRLIMRFQILSVYVGNSIYRSILKMLRGTEQPICLISDTLHLNGIQAKKAKNGIKNMFLILYTGLIDLKRILIVQNAIKRLRSITQMLYIADQSVGLLSIEKGISIPKRVYDLSIKDTPEYYANGILVHNCIDTWCYFLHTSHYTLAEILSAEREAPEGWQWHINGFRPFGHEEYRGYDTDDYDDDYNLLDNLDDYFE